LRIDDANDDEVMADAHVELPPEPPLPPPGYESWADVPPDDVELPAGEDLGYPSDEENDEEFPEPEVKMETGFGNVLVVDNLPVVPEEKFEKLKNVLTKIFSQLGTLEEGGIFLPKDSKGLTKGFAFVEYEDTKEAKQACEQTNGYMLDKSHVFRVTMFDDFAKYLKVPDEYQKPDKKDFKQVENLQEWILDQRGREQFAARYADETDILWNDPQKSEPDVVHKRTFWTESYVQWSPKGRYLATVHRQGVALWGGKSWMRLHRFSHPMVRFIDFSPDERYLVTYSTADQRSGKNSDVLLNIFEVRSGKKLRTFQGQLKDYLMPGSDALSWPVLKWSGGDKGYFAKIGKNAIGVYEAPEMTLIGKKSMKLENVLDFCWSPTDSIISFYQPESDSGNIPARVALVSIPSKTEVKSKNLFGVSDVKMIWQPNGEYLAIQVERFTKSKKNIYTSFELLRLNEKNVPMEVLSPPDQKEKIHAFVWEPKGPRFAIVHGNGPRPSVTFYTMRDKNGKVKLLHTLTNKQCNSIFWSPQGSFVLLAGLKSMNGQLEFFNVDDLETMATAEHFMCNYVNWDPTGRFVATSVTSENQMENGYQVWSFNGKLLTRQVKDRFYQFLWRPHPPSLLSEEEIQQVKKDLKKYIKKYEAEDEAFKLAMDENVMSERKALLEKWNAWFEKKVKLREEEKSARAELRGYASDEEEEGEETEIEIEEVIDIREEIMYGQ